jgi:hypothetical protein
MTRLLCAILLLSSSVLAKDPAADALVQHTITIAPRGQGAAYINLHDGKAYEEKDAAAHKDELDFVYLVTKDPNNIERDLYDLSGHDTHLPAEVVGGHAGIVSLGWDDDLIAKCKTVADLKRMAGSYTVNSFSFFANMASNPKGELDHKSYIFLDGHGRMGIFTLKQGEGDTLVLQVKITP